MLSWAFFYVTFWAVPCLRRLVIAYHTGDSSSFLGQCGICGVSGDTLTVFLRDIRVFLSKCSFHKRSIFIHLSFKCWTLGPLEAAVHPKNSKQLFFFSNCNAIMLLAGHCTRFLSIHATFRELVLLRYSCHYFLLLTFAAPFFDIIPAFDFSV